MEMPPQPLRPVEQPTPAVRVEAERDLVHWGPTWAGVFVPVALLLLLAPLGVVLGLTDPTGAAIWAGISLVVAFFVGGWVVGRTLSFGDTLIAGAHGLLAWAVAFSFLLLTILLLSAIGATGLAAVPAEVIPGIAVPAALVTGASLGAFFALLLSAIASVVGATVGNQGRPHVEHL